ncbi:MAG TPA: bifunctional nuclease domain-containing protein [Candidatus Sphingobacterium stercoripullorum]|uniref:Bifunctional nuclease family protein n=1 Tax=Candidatus Sphingobacterium stercoripullorum TaxID=2838759 RepID=A0A9D2AZJ4_9SPHI|nr:bifunctional nuclease family protein [Candidatus Sphingobacterium stercoripullorum]HLR50573.1 bifunctional nuclease domain-containing protein [Candidatus Sphingobacterium stercoripullorum]
MDKVRLDIVGLSFSETQSGAYALVFAEQSGNRRLPVIIGGYEAQAIAIEIEGMEPSRPLTHDLLKAVFIKTEVELIEVLIYDLQDGVFYAKLICKQGEETFEIDSRTSDAIALAVRLNCPIFTREFILDEAGIIIDSDDFAFLENLEGTTEQEVSSSPKKKKSAYSSYSNEQLEERLQKAINDEQYEMAAEIRDEIDRRSKDKR